MKQMGGKAQKAIDEAIKLLNDLEIDFCEKISEASYSYNIIISKKKENLKKLNVEVIL